MLKKNILITCGIVTIFFIVGMVLKSKIINSSLCDITNINSMNRLNVSFLKLYMYDDLDVQDIEENKEYDIECLGDYSCIFVVKPLEKIKIAENVLQQNVIVNDVVKGDENLVGNEIVVQSSNTLKYSSWEMEKYDDNGNIIEIENEPRLYFNSHFNVMRNEYEYVVFADKVELGRDIYSSEKSEYSILRKNCDKQCSTTMKNISKFKFENSDDEYDGVSVNYVDIRECELFTTSDKVLDAFNELKSDIFRKYKIEI